MPADAGAAGTPPATRPDDLKRVIGLWDAAALVVGLIIGSGIFRSPTEVARHLPDATWIFVAWILGGALSLAGGLAAAELGVRYPRSGGQYVFLREAFGPSVAFAFGWSSVLIARPAVLAGIAIVFADYFAPLFGIAPDLKKTLAAGAVLLFTAVNCLGVKQGTRTQNLFTLVKVLGLGLLAGAALLAGRGDAAHFTSSFSQPLEHSLPVALALGLVTILYTYDGWIDVTYVGGEVVRPEKVFPRAILIGTATCLTLYLLANAAYVLLLSPAEMATTENIGAVALERAFGPVGNILLSVLVVISTLGILNGAVLSGVRVPYAMARDGMLFAVLGRVHPGSGSPVNALLAQGLFTVLVIVFSAGFDQVASLFVSVTWFFYAVTFIGLLLLQRRERRTGVPSGTGEGRFRMPLSPWPAVIFVVVTFFIIGSDMVFGGPQVLIGLGLVALGVPIYWIWQAWVKR